MKCLWLILAAVVIVDFSPVNGNSIGMEQTGNSKAPPYLYKILSLENWKESQAQHHLILSKDDNAFIHLASEDQLDRIAGKYWSNVPEYVILKLDSAQLQGRLVYEANPGGSTKYYHLYEGSIPLQAVSSVKIIRPE